MTKFGCMQSTSGKAVRPPRGNTIDPQRSSTRPRDTTAAAASLAVCGRTREFQTLRPGVSLSYMVSALNTSQQTLRSASSTDVVLTATRRSWRPRISGRKSSGMERVTA